jgi:hypothetical protein
MTLPGEGVAERAVKKHAVGKFAELSVFIPAKFVKFPRLQ